MLQGSFNLPLQTGKASYVPGACTKDKQGALDCQGSLDRTMQPKQMQVMGSYFT